MSENMFVVTDHVSATASFTPTVASFTAGNIIDTAKEFVFTDRDSRIVPKGSLIRVLTAVLKIDAAALISGEGAYTMHGYDVTPPSGRANNAAWARASTDLAVYRGALALGTPVAAGGSCYLKTQFTDMQDFKLVGTSLFFELINAGTFTGAAVARQITLHGLVI
jgi:hypothetical protein